MHHYKWQENYTKVSEDVCKVDNSELGNERMITQSSLQRNHFRKKPYLVQLDSA